MQKIQKLWMQSCSRKDAYMERKFNAGNVAKLGVLVALAMIFSYVELLIPFSVGIAGVKLGLANLVVVIGLYILSATEVFLVSMVRIFLMALLFGNGASILYSLAGGILSFLVMLIAKKFSGLSIVGISILGAVFHNIGQIMAAAWMLGTMKILSYLPVLLIAGIVTGMAIGIVAGQILNRIKMLS